MYKTHSATPKKFGSQLLHLKRQLVRLFVAGLVIQDLTHLKEGVVAVAVVLAVEEKDSVAREVSE
jgi:hypothetical protein